MSSAVLDELLWPDQDRRWDTDWFTCRSVSPHLYSYFIFLLAYRKLLCSQFSWTFYSMTVTNKLPCLKKIIVFFIHQCNNWVLPKYSNNVAVSTIGVQYDSGIVSLAHWSSLNGQICIEIQLCQCNIYVIYSQYCIKIWQQYLYCMYHLIATLKNKAISKQFYTFEYVPWPHEAKT